MKLAVITSGGDAPGMNACLFGLVQSAASINADVIGFVGGWEGILHDECVPLTKDDVAHCINNGGTILHSDRSQDWLIKEKRLEGLENLRRHGAAALVVIGGDGSFRGAGDLASDTGFPVFCIPASIDNDLGYTSYTIGFDTALNTVVTAINSIKETCYSHGKPCVVEVMGRHCGDLAMQSGIAAGADFVLVPELPFDIEKIAEKMKARASGGDRDSRAVIIVLAEGAAKLEPFCEELEKLTGISCRQTRLGFIQRGGSPTVVDRLRAMRMAAAAVKEAAYASVTAATGEAVAVGVRGDTVITMSLSDALQIRKILEPDLKQIIEIK